MKDADGTVCLIKAGTIEVDGNDVFLFPGGGFQMGGFCPDSMQAMRRINLAKQ